MDPVRGKISTKSADSLANRTSNGMEDIAIKVDNVSKTFKLPHEKHGSFKSALLNLFKGSRTYERQETLKDISFEIKEGEFFGIIGRNGSGKSTLLKLIAGIYAPSSGNIQINGRLTPFIELGVGFNPELTGRENVFLNGALMGFNRSQMEKMYDEIVDFAELEKFMDQKLKNYSSGMQVRLAFSIAIRAKSDILLLDEVLAVGDIIFQKKCFEYFKTLKKEGNTVVLVSHDSNVLEEYCQNGILLEAGKIHSAGKMKNLVKEYLDLMNKSEESGEAKKTTKTSKAAKRWGTQKMVVEQCIIKGQTNNPQLIFGDDQKQIFVEVSYKSKIDGPGPIYGIVIEDMAGIKVFESNTKRQKLPTKPTKPGDIIKLTWEVPNIFNTGTYYVSPAVASHDETEMYDWRDGLGNFKIRKITPSNAITNVSHSIKAKD